MSNKGCISCVNCKVIGNHYFCGNARLTEKQVYNSKGYCSNFKGKTEKGGKRMTVEEEMKILEEINKEIIKKGRLLYNYEIKEVLDRFIVKHDNAPTVDIKDEIAGAYNEGYMCGSREAEKARPQGECRTCRHRDPEDKKCDCGGKERQGCPFPVSDDYFCKFYEKGGKE